MKTKKEKTKKEKFGEAWVDYNKKKIKMTRILTTKIKEIEMKIIQDKKQTRVSIPSEFVERLNIDSKNDRIMWSLISYENGTSLIGSLKRKENEKKDI
jgi:hypothetical protein